MIVLTREHFQTLSCKVPISESERDPIQAIYTDSYLLFVLI